MHLAGRPVRATELHRNNSWRGRLSLPAPPTSQRPSTLGGEVPSVAQFVPRAEMHDAEAACAMGRGRDSPTRNAQSQANRGNGKWAMAGRIGRLDDKVARSGEPEPCHCVHTHAASGLCLEPARTLPAPSWPSGLEHCPYQPPPWFQNFSMWPPSAPPLYRPCLLCPRPAAFLLFSPPRGLE